LPRPHFENRGKDLWPPASNVPHWSQTTFERNTYRLASKGARATAQPSLNCSERVITQKEKGKKKQNPPPTPPLKEEREKKRRKKKGKLQPLDLDIRQGAVCFPFSTDGDSAALAHPSKLRPACSDLR
jgi:hypothetical protein